GSARSAGSPRRRPARRAPISRAPPRRAARVRAGQGGPPEPERSRRRPATRQPRPWPSFRPPPASLDGPGLDGLPDPRDDLVQYGRQRGRRLEAENQLGLFGGGGAAAHVRP